MGLDTLAGNQNRYLENTSFHNQLNGLAAFTMLAWINSRIIGTDKGVCIAAAPVGSDKDFSFRYDSSGGSGGGNPNVIKFGIITTLDPGERQLESSANIQQTVEQHMVLCAPGGGTNLHLYLDGQFDTPTFVETYSGVITNCTSWILGKGGKDTGSATWDGLIEAFRVYDRGLDPKEISTIFALRGCDGIRDGLIGEWRLNEGAPGTPIAIARDIVGGFDMTPPVNAPNYTASTVVRRRRCA